MKCHLCQSEAELLKSHIIPEFFFKPLYDPKHRFHAISTEKGDKNLYEQKGLREQLLCRKCESLLMKWEDYVSKVFYGGTEIEIDRKRNLVRLGNLRYDYFKLFELSVLWRASVSKHEFFSGITLGKHEEKIRQRILSENPGEPYQYGSIKCIIMTENGDVRSDMIMQPECMRVYGQRCFRFVFGGTIWLFVVSSHSDRFELKDLYLRKNGIQIIPMKKESDIEFIKRFALNFKHTGKLNSILAKIKSKK